MPGKDSNEALNAISEPEGRALTRGLGWYAGLAELRRVLTNLAAIGGVTVLAYRGQLPVPWAVGAIVVIALPTHVGDFVALGRRIVQGGGADDRPPRR